MQTVRAVGGTASGAPARPQLLALHGWRTSAAVLKTQLRLSGLDVALREVADVVFLDAPHPARGPPDPDVARFFSPPFAEWWDAVQDPGAPAGGGAVRYEGAEAALGAVEAALRSAAAAGSPVSGLLGFSQGATLAGLVLAMQERGRRFTDVPPLRCGVLICGGIARDPAFTPLYGTTGAGDGGGDGALGAADGPVTAASPQAAAPPPPLLRTPSVHLIGAADPLCERSEQLAAAFAAPLLTLRHERGHVVPRLAPEQRSQLLDFLSCHLAVAAPAAV